MMSELRENVWSVISERGVEAAHLTYDEAREGERNLMREKLSGCAIVTDAAAARIQKNEAEKRS